MRVTDPDGVEWEVRREWLELPRWNRFAGRDVLDGGVWGLDDSDLGAVVVLLVLVLLFVFVGIPLLVFLAGVLVAVGGLVLRILFGRPWRVEASSERGELAWRVRGTRGSRRALHEIAAVLRRGERDVMPAGAERLLPESPLRSYS